VALGDTANHVEVTSREISPQRILVAIADDCHCLNKIMAKVLFCLMGILLTIFKNGVNKWLSGFLWVERLFSKKIVEILQI
jgi:hypothetical protein